jgi:hypothetical protein
MNIKDKINLSDKGQCCPPHYLPHKLPAGDKVTDEPCHVHKAKWRRAHHYAFCQVLKCPHYPEMREKSKDVIK